MPALVFDNVTKQYPTGQAALRDVDLRIDDGERVVLLGANGSGKSTLLRCAVGFERVTSGRVLVGDVDVTHSKGRRLREVRRAVGLLHQHDSLLPGIRVFDNVVAGALGRTRNPLRWLPSLSPDDARDRAVAALEAVGLAHLARRRTGTLSGGERQRVALARVLVQEPNVVLADEPVASLDPAASRQVLTHLWRVAGERGMSVVCALHQLDLAGEFADRIIGLADGRVVFDGPFGGAEELSRLYATARSAGSAAA